MELDGDEPPTRDWLKAFLNPVILDCLMKYLQLKEMEVLRCTSLEINEIISSSRMFLNRALFNVYTVPRKCSDPYRTMEVLEASDVKWKNLEIDVDNLTREEFPPSKNLRHIMQTSAEFMKLSDPPKFFPPFGNLRPREVVGIVRSQVCENLQHLSVDYGLIETVSFLFDNLPGELKKVDIHPSSWRKTKEDETLECVLRNLDTLSSRCRNLEQFTIHIYLKFTDTSLRRSFFNIIRGNAETLCTLRLNLGTLASMDDFKFINCPSLKILEIYCGKRNACSVNTFMKNQTICKMEEISLHFLDPLPLNSIPLVFQTILKWKKSIKALSFYFVRLEDTNWEFLSQMEVLENFSLLVAAFTQSVQRLEHFPKSLKTFSLHGLQCGQYSDLYTFVRNSAFPSENLSVLSFCGSRPTTLDADLQIICSTMTNLKTLELSCSYITDYGVTGIPPLGSHLVPTGMSIANLKRLEVFKLNHCPAITTGIVKALNFQWLGELNLEDNNSLVVTDDFLVALVTNNPRLQKVAISNGPLYHRGDFTDLKNIVLLRSHGKCSLVVENLVTDQ